MWGGEVSSEVQNTDSIPVADAGEAFTSNEASTSHSTISTAADSLQTAADNAQSAINACAEPINIAVSDGRDDDAYRNSYDKNRGGLLTQLNNDVKDAAISGDKDDATLDAERKKVSDAAKTLVEDAKRGEDKEIGMKPNTELDAKEYMDNVAKGIAADAEKLKEAGKIAGQIDAAVNEQSEALGELNQAVNDAEITIEGSTGIISMETGNIDRAGSIAAVNEAYASAEDANKDAHDAYDAVKAEYDNMVTAVDDKKAAIQELEQQYTKLIADLNTDEGDLSKIEAELNQDKADLQALITATQNAQKKLGETALGKLASNLKDTSEKQISNWNQADAIFKDVLKYYYFPTQNIKPENVRFDNKFTKPGSEDANYIRVYIKGEDGNETVHYFNYKCDKNKKSADYNKTTSMVIFEKNAALIEAEHYETADGEKLLIDVEKEAVKIDVFAGIEQLAGKDQVVVDTDAEGKPVYYKVTTIDYKADNKVTESTVADDGDGKDGTEVKITDTSVTTDITDGRLTETTVGTVTTTKFVKNASLSGTVAESGTYGSEEEARAAAQAAAVNAVTAELEGTDKTLQGEGAVTANTTISSTTEKVVEYRTKFETKIEIESFEFTVKEYNTLPAEEIYNKVFAELMVIVKKYLPDSVDKDSVTYTAAPKNLEIKDGKLNGVPKSITFTYYMKDTSTVSVPVVQNDGKDKGKPNPKDDKPGQQPADNKEALVKAAVEAAKKSEELIDDDAIKGGSDGKSFCSGPYYTSGLKIKKGKDAVKTTAQAVNPDDDKKVGAKDVKEQTSYTYSVSDVTYDYYTTEIKDNQVISVKSCDAKELSYVADKYEDIPSLNDNYNNLISGLTDKLTGFICDMRTNVEDQSETRKAVDADVANYNKLQNQYGKVITDSETAIGKIDTALNTVGSLKTAINALTKETGVESQATFKDTVAAVVGKLDAQLAAIGAKLNIAEGSVAAADTALDDADAARIRAIARLTPAPAGGGAGGGAGETGTGAATPLGAALMALAAEDEAPAAGLAGGAADAGVLGARTARSTSRGGAGTVEDGDAGNDTEETKPADTKAAEEIVADTDDDTVKKTERKETTVIEDEEVAKAAVGEETAKKFGWWWILIAAALGITAEEAYRRYKKKENAAAIADSIKKSGK